MTRPSAGSMSMPILTTPRARWTGESFPGESPDAGNGQPGGHHKQPQDHGENRGVSWLCRAGRGAGGGEMGGGGRGPGGGRGGRRRLDIDHQTSRAAELEDTETRWRPQANSIAHDTLEVANLRDF